MKAFLLLLFALLALPASAATQRSSFDLVGKWEGRIEFNKFKFNLLLRVAKTSAERLAVTMDVPDQGQRDVPINALLFSDPDVRIEIDQFGTAYNGKLSEDKNEISGEFEEGPGGRPIHVVFKRSTAPDAPEPEKVFTFAKGEPPDIRGYWKATLEAFPGMTVAMALNIGKIPDGSFLATLDLLDQGAKDIPASSVAVTNKTARLQWQAFQATINAVLSEDGKTLDGSWQQGGRSNKVILARLEERATALPKNLSFVPEKNQPEDIRGLWKGILELPNQRLRLEVEIGRTPDGSYGGTLSSLDQGGSKLPMSTASFTAPKIHLEWRGIRGKFEGTLNKEGSVMEGTWEQGGNPLPLKLERATASDKEKQS
jgi:hypothetical protein